MYIIINLAMQVLSTLPFIQKVAISHDEKNYGQPI